MTQKDAKVTAIQKLAQIIKGGGGAFWRLLLILVIVGVIGIGGLMAWKGCEWTGKNSHLKVKGVPGAIQ